MEEGQEYGSLDGELDNQQEVVDQDGDGDTGGSGKAQKRIQKLSNELREFKALGYSPDQITEAMATLATLETAVKNGELTKPSSNSKGNDRQLDPKDQKALEKIYELIPELKNLEQLREQLGILEKETQSNQTVEMTRLKNQAAAWVSKQAAEDGFIPEVDPNADDADLAMEEADEASALVEDIVAQRLYADKKLRQRFENGDLRAVEEAYKKAQTTLNRRLVKVQKPSRKLPFTSSSSGMPGTRATLERGKPTKDQLAKMSPSDQKRVLDEHAFRVYTELAAARQGDE